MSAFDPKRTLAASPRALQRASLKPKMPCPKPSGAAARFVKAFKAGLKEGGYTEGQNIVIESRFAEGQTERLPAMAAELAGRGVQLIAAGGAEYPALAAKGAAAVRGDLPMATIAADQLALQRLYHWERTAGSSDTLTQP